MYDVNKTRNIKKQTYLDYFKYFASGALETTRKLETKFQDEFTDDVFGNSQHMMKLIKKLLSSYEVLILEINDSCQFVQIPDFGVCIVKIYFQLMSIIKYLVKNMLKAKAPNERVEREKRHNQRYTMMIPSNLDPFIDINNLKERQNIRLRENASHIFRDLTAQVRNLERQNKTRIEQSQDTLNTISKGRKKLQTIESSQSQAVLAQTVNMLFNKGQHINNFINLLQSTQLQNKEAQPQSYSKLKQKIDEQNNGKMEKAQMKLCQLLKAYALLNQNKKKASLISTEIQVDVQDDNVFKKRKTQYRKTNYDQVKKLRQQILSLEQQNNSLKEYIKTKNQEHENMRTEIIAEKIMLQSKLFASSSSQRGFTDKSRASPDIKRQTPKEDEVCQSIDKGSQIRSHFSIQDEDDRLKNDSGSDLFIRSNTKFNKVKIPKVNNISKVQFIQKQKNIQQQKQNKIVLKKSLSLCKNIVSHQYKKQISRQSSPLKKSKQPDENAISEIQSKSRMSKIQQQPYQSEDQRNAIAQLDKASRVDSDTHLLKITDPLSNSLRNRSQLRQKNVPSQQELSKSKKVSVNHFSQFTINESLSQVDKYKTKSKVFKKESILDVIGDNDCKRKSNFSQLSCFKSDLSKDLIKIMDKQSSEEVTMRQKANVQGSGPDKESVFFRSPSLPSDFNPKNIKTPLNFDKDDLIAIFICQDNAKSYEFLNLSLAAKHKKYISTLAGKKVVRSTISNQPRSQLQRFSESLDPTEMANILIGIFFEALTILKKDKINYRKLCNFLRYPYSSIYEMSSPAWQNYQNQQSKLEYIQVRKLIIRLSKLHSECEDVLCSHWIYFLRKLGVISM